MKSISKFIDLLALGFIVLNLFGWAFCTGESFPLPIPAAITVTVPFSLP
jgi:hypothetical protein